jgi:Outer membrane protein beta-barrel domain
LISLQIVHLFSTDRRRKSRDLPGTIRALGVWIDLPRPAATVGAEHHEERSDMAKTALRFLMIAALVLAGASKAAAQASQTTSSPSYELSAGYQFFHLPEMDFPFGLGIDGAMHFGKFGLVAEGGWALHSSDDDATVAGAEVTTNMWHIAAGPRFTGFSNRPLWPYGQVLVGLAIAHSSFDFDDIEDDSETETAFMVQPGFGVTFVAGDGWGIFAQADYRRTFFDEPDDADPSVNNGFRLFIGARMILD